jgi:hypothetical protein
VRRLATVVVAALAVAAPAVAAPRVEVVLVPKLDLSRYAVQGAVGLLVPGSGSTVTGAGALAALERGRVRSSLLGGRPHGQVLVRPSRRAGDVTFYVSLPGPGRHANVRRYPVAVVGRGYRGLLTSSNTRIDGLLSVADIAPSIVALRDGRTPAIRSRSSADAVGRLHALDRRLARAHDSRSAANVVLVVLVAGFSALALLLRSALLARAALLAAPTVLLVALALSATDVSRPGPAVTALAALSLVLSLGAASICGERRAFAAALLLVFPLELIVLWAWPEVGSLAVIGPHPDGGGRFYGVTNQVETLLLVPALLPAALLDRRCLAPVALLAVLVVGAAATGADGAGGIVLVAGFLTLGVRIAGLRLTVPRLAAIAAGAVAAAVGFVGLDAALGGSSHVTRAVRGGPVHLVGLFLHRLHVSAAGVVASVGAGTLFAVGLAVLVVLATRRPRPAPLDALLVALGVSLLVNDTPTDVVFYGAFAGLALWIWARIGDVEAGLRPAGEPGGPS